MSRRKLEILEYMVETRKKKPYLEIEQHDTMNLKTNLSNH